MLQDAPSHAFLNIELNLKILRNYGAKRPINEQEILRLIELDDLSECDSDEGDTGYDNEGSLYDDLQPIFSEIDQLDDQFPSSTPEQSTTPLQSSSTVQSSILASRPSTSHDIVFQRNARSTNNNAKPRSWKMLRKVPKIPNFDKKITCNSDYTHKTQPVEMFDNFFPVYIVNNIVEQTNLYAHQNNCKNWTDVTSSEIRAYLGVLIMMGLNPLPDVELYWSSDPFYNNSEMTKAFPIVRFKKISENLHLNDNEKVPTRESQNFDKLYKVRPLIDSLNIIFQKETANSSIQSIDECMVKFKGRSSLKQYMPKKPIKRGFKVWARCDAKSGYLYQFEIYTGKGDSMENEAVTASPITAIKWLDTREVTVLTTAHQPRDTTFVKRTQKNGSRQEVLCPKAIADYTLSMGGWTAPPSPAFGESRRRSEIWAKGKLSAHLLGQHATPPNCATPSQQMYTDKWRKTFIHVDDPLELTRTVGTYLLTHAARPRPPALGGACVKYRNGRAAAELSSLYLSDVRGRLPRTLMDGGGRLLTNRPVPHLGGGASKAATKGKRTFSSDNSRFGVRPALITLRFDSKGRVKNKTKRGEARGPGARAKGGHGRVGSIYPRHLSEQTA
ncbi:PiggyBac transposable element-derived protein 4 [Eumeta japonica]|uniref:PiggyBac transposable element-derived protein 4 n=1 Tax=Eumeta variegata TaxID=151549 RepID=A0A4C1ZU87_EUMVA|nr:PiggyBac transposable element-derived protein 4 [Eumeta japonica]